MGDLFAPPPPLQGVMDDSIGVGAHASDLTHALADVLVTRLRGVQSDGRGLFTRVGALLLAANPQVGGGGESGGGSGSGGSSSSGAPTASPASVYHPTVMWRYDPEAERLAGAEAFGASPAARGGRQAAAPFHPHGAALPLPPHLFAATAGAMQAAVRGGVPQVFVFQGERGSGKSDGARAAVLYFSTVARAVTLRLSARVDALRTQALDAALRAARSAPVMTELLAAAAHVGAVRTAATGVGSLPSYAPPPAAAAHAFFPSDAAALVEVIRKIKGEGKYGAAAALSGAAGTAGATRLLPPPPPPQPAGAPQHPFTDAAAAAARRGRAPMEDLLPHIFTLLDAFGCAGEGATPSPTSSRYARRVALELEVGGGAMTGASVHAALLEPWRVACRPPATALAQARARAAGAAAARDAAARPCALRAPALPTATSVGSPQRLGMLLALLALPPLLLLPLPLPPPPPLTQWTLTSASFMPCCALGRCWQSPSPAPPCACPATTLQTTPTWRSMGLGPARPMGPGRPCCAVRGRRARAAAAAAGGQQCWAARAGWARPCSSPSSAPAPPPRPQAQPLRTWPARALLQIHHLPLGHPPLLPSPSAWALCGRRARAFAWPWQPWASQLLCRRVLRACSLPYCCWGA